MPPKRPSFPELEQGFGTTKLSTFWKESQRDNVQYKKRLEREKRDREEKAMQQQLHDRHQAEVNARNAAKERSFVNNATANDFWSRLGAPGDDVYAALREFYLLCHNEALGQTVQQRLTGGFDPVNWHTIKISPPGWWAKVAVARRALDQPPTWAGNVDDQPHYDCLFFNTGAKCSNKLAGHGEYHRCMLCGLKHALQCTSVVDLIAAENGPCEAWKAIARAFDDFCNRNYAEGTDRRAIERVLMGEQKTFTYYDRATYNTVYEEAFAGGVPTSKEAPTAAAAAAAAADTDAGAAAADTDAGAAAADTDAGAAAADTDAGAAAADTDGGLPPASPRAGARLKLDIDAFKADFDAEHQGRLKPAQKHNHVWFPWEPREHDDVLIWCDQRCCTLGRDSRQSVRCARFYQRPTRKRTGAGAPAVVKVFTEGMPDKGGNAGEDRGWKREVRAFQRLYPAELLIFDPSYSFKSTREMAFIATRRHEQDLSSLLCDVDAKDDRDERIAQRLELVRCVLGEMSHAHEAMVHGDVKPQNFVQVKAESYAPERVMLIDFEFSRTTTLNAAKSTTVAGHTQLWSSPTQALGRGKSKADDTFALALVIYEIMCDPKCRGDSEELKRTTPQFWLDLYAEELAEASDEARDALEKLPPIEFASASTLKPGPGRYSRAMKVAPRVPSKCHPLVKPLLDAMFTHWADTPGTSSVPSNEVSFVSRTSLLSVDPGSLCLILLRLHHLVVSAGDKATPQSDTTTALKNIATARPDREYFEHLPDVVGSVVVANMAANGANAIKTVTDLRAARMCLMKALRTLRNIIAHPTLSPAVTMAQVMWFCPALITDLEAAVSASFPNTADRVVDGVNLGITFFNACR